MASEEYEYDVFISYAVEDKIGIVTDLVLKLEEMGIKVWYAAHRLSVGRGVHETIKEGLSKSRHGIVILSHNYFQKDWPKRELHVLWSRENGSDRRILPIWHNIDEKEVRAYDSLLADNYGIPTNQGVEFVANKLVSAIAQSNAAAPKATNNLNNARSLKWQWWVSGLLLFCSLLGGIYFLSLDVPAETLIRNRIEQRISAQQEIIMNDHLSEMRTRNGKLADIQEVIMYYDRYDSLKAPYRNEYYFNTGFAEFNYKKNVEPKVGLSVEALTPYNRYNFEEADIFIIDKTPALDAIAAKYIFVNTKPVNFEIVNEDKTEERKYLVRVKYSNPIRYLSVDLSYAKQGDGMKRRLITFLGLSPQEIFQFEKKGQDWVFAGISDGPLD